MKRFLLAFVALVALPAVAQEVGTCPFVERDSTLYLDVYRPATPRADRAAVISLFGGGFIVGERNNSHQRSVGKMLSERGFTVVCIDYRLGLKDTVRTKQFKGLKGMQGLFQYCIDLAVEDCAAAVAWVCSHADSLGVDTSKIVLTGCSAGAIAVLQLDWCRANGEKTVAALPAGWRPAAVVPYSGGIMSHGKPTWKTPPAPTMLMHGTKDKIVAYKKFPPILSYGIYGAKKVFKQMRKQEYPCWIIRFEGIGHEVSSWLPGSIDLFCAFVNQALDGRITTLDATMTDAKLVPTKWTTMNLKDLYAK